MTVNGSPVDVRGTTLEQPPNQGLGGGWNSSLNVPAVSGAVVLNAPVNNNESISVRFRLGVMATGRFTFLVNIEAANGCAEPAFEPCGPVAKPLQIK